MTSRVVMTRVVMTLRLPDRTGAAKMALGFAAALAQDGVGTTLVHGPLPVDQPSVVPDFEALGARTVLERRLERPYDPRLVPALAALVRREEAVAVVGVNQRDRAPALLAAARAGVPGVLMVQNQHRFWGPRPLAALKRASYRAAVARWTTLAVCTSDVVRDEMTAFGVPAARTAVLPNGIDVRPPVRLADAERAALREQAGARPGEVLLLSVGRLDPQKGQDLLLRALAEPAVLPGVHVALVGSSGDSVAARQTLDYERALRADAARLGLDGVVTFLGWRDDVDRLLAASDGYVHTARWEGPALPLAVMEAMAAARATVLTDCSGWPPGFTQGEHGLVARSEDVPSIRAALEDLLAMAPAQRDAVGAAAAELIAARYRVQDVGRRFAALVRGAVDGDGRG